MLLQIFKGSLLQLWFKAHFKVYPVKKQDEDFEFLPGKKKKPYSHQSENQAANISRVYWSCTWSKELGL